MKKDDKQPLSDEELNEVFEEIRTGESHGFPFSQKEGGDMSEKVTNEQNITYDSFEESLKHDGIEIIVPDEDGEPQKGIGASGYVPRRTAPSYTNPFYLKSGMGGYNRCILIQGNSCLANCVGFAHGRLLEQGGSTGNSKIPTCNAEDWLAVAKANGLKTGATPKLGAVIVWKSGNLWNGRDGCGHVGVVEEVYPDGSILVGQSNYGGTRFFLTRHKPPYSIFGQTFIGFVYSPYVEDSEGTAMWKNDETGWWYDNGDGTYPKNQWKQINGEWYYFNDSGYMVTGWIKDKGIWYYCDEKGKMLKSTWLKYKEKWYFLGRNGAMFTGNHQVPVHFNSNGEFDGNKR